MEIGDYIAIQITGEVRKYIAEVTQVEPLRLKVEESGPFANLKEDDFIVLVEETCCLNDVALAQKTLREAVKKGHPYVSGLRSLGIEDNKLHTVLPMENEIDG